MKEDKYCAERSELVSIEMNDIALLVSYRKRQAFLFYGGFSCTEKTSGIMSDTILPCLSRNASKSVRELCMHTVALTWVCVVW